METRKYSHREIEAKWWQKWRDEKVYEVDVQNAKKPFYNLWMFPYPSGARMHVGHAYGSTGSDVFGRYKRMHGYDVLQPMGFDAFGIHGENYAIKVGEHPWKLMEDLCNRFRDEQFLRIGHGYDWSKEVRTYWPQYYKWTQWIFLQLFKHGLAEKKTARVNWCPSCKTVLADEQVIGGACERCHTEVEKKELEQWFFKITKFAQKLLDDLDDMDWSPHIKELQRNWIGRSEGAEISFKVAGSDHTITVFTTRPDTLPGATFLVLAPEYKGLSDLVAENKREEIDAYVKTATAKSTIERSEAKEKTGVFTGSYAINPVTNEKMPIWIADYVLSDYGTGAIMAVPAHDERDFEFAVKHGLPIREVVKEDDSYVGFVLSEWSKDFGAFVNRLKDLNVNFLELDEDTAVFSFDKSILKKIVDIAKDYVAKGSWHDFVGSDLTVVFEDGEVYHVPKYEENPKVWARMCTLNPDLKASFGGIWDMLLASKYQNYGKVCFTGDGISVNSELLDGLSTADAKGKVIDWLEQKGLGKKSITLKLRDWLISRQRYWSAPIPVVYCDKCGVVPVNEEDLPVKLPYVEDWKPKGDGKGPLANIPEFVNTTCPKCGGPAQRETDTLDNFLDSAWYFFRYPFVKRNDVPFAGPGVNDADNAKPDSNAFKRWLPVDLYLGGAEHAVLHLMYTRFITMAFKEMGFIDFDEPFKKFFAHGMIIKDGKKMSKSLGNIINPDEYIDMVGADVLRTYLMFLGPLAQGGDFSDSGMSGIVRFKNKIIDLVRKSQEVKESDKNLESKLHKTIKKVNDSIESFKYNTAISALMELSNEWAKGQLSKTDAEKALKLLAPFMPFITEELWQEFYADKNSETFVTIHKQPWPEYDESKVIEEAIKLPVQINGKLRATIIIDPEVVGDEDKIIKLAKDNEVVSRFLADKEIIKTIYVSGRILNFVVS